MIFNLPEPIQNLLGDSRWTRRFLFAAAGVLTGLGYGVTLSLLVTQQPDHQTLKEPRFQEAAPTPVQTEPARRNQPLTESTVLSDGCVVPPQGGPPVNADFEPC